ncbi:YcbK family protein [Desulfuromonas versatilis]|nr:DUF882 domain-containing protein [Desulfuromonas versatilis]
MENLKSSPCDRRRFLKLGLAAAAGLALPVTTWARLPEFKLPERTLSLYNIHTGETLRKAVYWAEGVYVPETLAEINHLLRDHRSNKVKKIDPRLCDLLFALRRRLEEKDPVHIISGYRSPETNAQLRKASSGVAKHSLHMEGKAADISLPGRDLGILRKAALGLKVGGVGYYPKSGFVHVDTGKVRSW